MKRSILIVFVIFIATFAIIGCEPTVDGSSQESFQESTSEIFDSLDEEEKARVGMYMLGMMMEAGFEAPNLPPSLLSDEEERRLIRHHMYERVDGMTASDIIEEAESMDHNWGDPEDYFRGNDLGAGLPMGDRI